jgi:hypothetical protein
MLVVTANKWYQRGLRADEVTYVWHVSNHGLGRYMLHARGRQVGEGRDLFDVAYFIGSLRLWERRDAELAKRREGC